MILLAGLSIYLFKRASEEEPILKVRVYTHAGTYEVAEFLEFLSQGPLSVTMDRRLSDELRRRSVTIRTPAHRDVPLQYVLENVLIPQLPGPEQWTYEVVGKTVNVKRGR